MTAAVVWRPSLSRPARRRWPPICPPPGTNSVHQITRYSGGGGVIYPALLSSPTRTPPSWTSKMKCGAG